MVRLSLNAFLMGAVGVSRRAIAIHRAFDLPLVGGQDGKVVYVSADEAEKNLSL